MRTNLQLVALCLLLAQGQLANSQQAGTETLMAGKVEDRASAVFVAGYRQSAIRVLLAPEKETVLSSSAAAVINGINVSLGSAFEKGETLLTFSCDEQIAMHQMAEAELSGALETHEGKIRMQGLKQASDIEVALAASEVAQLRAKTSLAQIQIEKCEVVAPWRGRVSKLLAKNHMTVAAGEPLMELVKDGPLKIRLNVPSAKVTELKPGHLFEVSIDETGRSYKAKIVAINSRIDPVSQTLELEARMVENYPGLLAGMSGTASLGLD